MAVRTLDHRTSLLGLFPHLSYTLSRLKARPEGAPHVAAFEEVREEGVQVLTTEIGLAEQVASAQSLVDVADDNLDDFASRVSKAVLTITKDHKDTKLYAHFFGQKTLSEFRRPVLKGQHEAMERWLPSLEQSPYPALQGMAAELSALLAQADAAVLARNAARQQNRFFRDVGDRKRWVDRLNATRKEVYGALSKLPHENPGLPSGFADQFFQKETRREGGEGDEPEGTAEELRAQVDELRAALAEMEARLAAAEAAEAEMKRAEAARAEAEAQLAELDRAAAGIEQRRAELQARLAAAQG
jgi:hypothetical protein